MRNYDFQDLMAFGMFILALLTFIFQYSRESRHRKTASVICELQGGFSNQIKRQPTLWAVVLFIYNIT